MDNVYIPKNDVEFEEGVLSREYESITLYFIVNKKFLTKSAKKYEKIDSVEVSVEISADEMEASSAQVMFSPTKDGEDYDWNYVEIPYEDIEFLLDVWRKSKIRDRIVVIDA